MSEQTPTSTPECKCFPVPSEYWTTHYGAVDPATTHDPNPECRACFPENFEDDGLDQAAQEGEVETCPVTRCERHLGHELPHYSPEAGTFDIGPNPHLPPGYSEALARLEAGALTDPHGVLAAHYGPDWADDPTETLGYRNGRRVVRGGPSAKVLSGDFDAAIEANLAETRDAIDDLRQWSDEPGDYTAQENPPLPPAGYVEQRRAARPQVTYDPNGWALTKATRPPAPVVYEVDGKIVDGWGRPVPAEDQAGAQVLRYVAPTPLPTPDLTNAVKAARGKLNRREFVDLGLAPEVTVEAAAPLIGAAYLEAAARRLWGPGIRAREDLLALAQQIREGGAQ